MLGAYTDYVQGIELLRQDAYNADKAIPYFEKAIKLDPRSALPYAGLADAQIQNFDKREGPKWLEMAAANVAKAEAINADSVPVLLVSGAFQESHGSYESALRAFPAPLSWTRTIRRRGGGSPAPTIRPTERMKPLPPIAAP